MTLKDYYELSDPEKHFQIMWGQAYVGGIICPLVGIQLITECTPKANGGLIIYKKTTQYYVVCNTMVIWVTELSSGRYKIRYKDFCLKNQNTQRKFVNFENWCNGELSKIGHHLSDLKIGVINKYQ